MHEKISGAPILVYLHSVPGVQIDPSTLRAELELVLGIGKALTTTMAASVINMKRVTAEIGVNFVVLTLSGGRVYTLIAKVEE